MWQKRKKNRGRKIERKKGRKKAKERNKERKKKRKKEGRKKNNKSIFVFSISGDQDAIVMSPERKLSSQFYKCNSPVMLSREMESDHESRDEDHVLRKGVCSDNDSVENESTRRRSKDSHENSPEKKYEVESESKLVSHRRSCSPHERRSRSASPPTSSTSKLLPNGLSHSSKSSFSAPHASSHAPVVAPLYPSPQALLLSHGGGMPHGLGSVPHMLPFTVPTSLSTTVSPHHGYLDAHSLSMGAHAAGLLQQAASGAGLGLYDAAALNSAYAQSACASAIFNGHHRLRFSPYALPVSSSSNSLAVHLPYESVLQHHGLSPVPLGGTSTSA